MSLSRIPKLFGVAGSADVGTRLRDFRTELDYRLRACKSTTPQFAAAVHPDDRGHILLQALRIIRDWPLELLLVMRQA